MTETPSRIPRLSTTGSLADQIRDSLYAAITSGELDPGTRLREIPLSEHFGVSTTPIREALRRLEYQGLVEVHHPRRGAVVTALQPSTVSGLYDLRLILETTGVRLAAASGGPLERVDELLYAARQWTRSFRPARRISRCRSSVQKMAGADPGPAQQWNLTSRELARNIHAHPPSPRRSKQPSTCVRCVPAAGGMSGPLTGKRCSVG